MTSIEKLIGEAKAQQGVVNCIWRRNIIEAHQLVLEQAMLSEIAAYGFSETFGRIAWDLHITLDIELTAAGELLLPVSRAVYDRACDACDGCDASARRQGGSHG